MSIFSELRDLFKEELEVIDEKVVDNTTTDETTVEYYDCARNRVIRSKWEISREDLSKTYSIFKYIIKKDLITGETFKISLTKKEDDETIY